MSTQIVEDDGTTHAHRRVVEIDGGAPDSQHVFIETVRWAGPTEERHCFALDRAQVIAALKAEFGLVDALEVMFA